LHLLQFPPKFQNRLAFLLTSDLHSASLGPFRHTFSPCSNLLLKFVSPYLCPYSSPTLSF
jgi:hypothetical protein